ncbi:hypothetical protein BHE74_00014204 [Ensete ventricosum]|nr:hypothetical protein BHE74_00014204 [Ensete ventricosum]RZR76448.1 hypothetical protein BHM03_00001230 [Ensete ventricosum]
MVRTSTRRVIDRHTPHLRDPRRAKSALSSVTRTATEKKSHSQRRKSLDKPTDLISPHGSSRYLLNDDAFFDVFPSADAAPPPLFSVERRRDIVQHRFRDEEGDGGWRRDPVGSPEQHLQGQECSVLAFAFAFAFIFAAASVSLLLIQICISQAPATLAFVTVPCADR